MFRVGWLGFVVVIVFLGLGVIVVGLGWIVGWVGNSFRGIGYGFLEVLV